MAVVARRSGGAWGEGAGAIGYEKLLCRRLAKATHTAEDWFLGFYAWSIYSVRPGIFPTKAFGEGPLVEEVF